MPTVGALIRRMNVLVVVLYIAAARIEVPTAKRNVIHQRVDFQNDGLVVLLGKRTQNQRSKPLTAQVRLDAEMLDIDVGAKVPIEDEPRKRTVRQAHVKMIGGITHDGFLVIPKTQLMAGKTRTVEGHGGIHEGIARVAAAAECDIHGKATPLWWKFIKESKRQLGLMTHRSASRPARRQSADSSLRRERQAWLEHLRAPCIAHVRRRLRN